MKHIEAFVSAQSAGLIAPTAQSTARASCGDGAPAAVAVAGPLVAVGLAIAPRC
jgi:hypothetical protein